MRFWDIRWNYGHYSNDNTDVSFKRKNVNGAKLIVRQGHLVTSITKIVTTDR